MDYYRLATRLGLSALVVATAVSCAQQRETINRVDAYALDKKFFVGPKVNDPSDDPEFYAATTIVDAPYGVSAGVFTGAVGELRRVKWEITQETLNGRLTYESIQGADGKGSRTTNTGQVVASFKIESHFDIKREYNPQTGEELNIISENTTDRPWYQRDFMRVDWSSNLVESAFTFDPLAMLKLDGVELEKLAYRVDPTDPDAPVFSSDDGYFDVTNKVYLKPATLGGSTVGGQTVGAVPACYYYAAIVYGGQYPFGQCDSAEVKLRLSFLRVSQAGDANFRDYEPKEWDGARFNAHGAFTHDRLGYDRHYGVIDSKWHHLLQRYNIWDKSHLAIPCTNAVDTAPADGTDDECAGGGAGSRCDDLVGQCTIPYALRKTRPNAWHYNLNADDEVIFDSTNRAAEEWDTAVRIAVQAARRVECQRTSGASTTGTRWDGMACQQAFPINQTDDAEVESVRLVNACWKEKGYKSADCAPADPNSVAALDPIIALCHNAVRAGDDPMCGKEGLVTRPGDLRYHEVNVIPTPQSASPWGYGPTLSDPLTGEVIQGGINVWNSVTDQAAQTMVDQIRWMNGELADFQITSGDYIQEWARAASAHVPGSAPLMTPGGIDQRVLGTGAMTADKLAQVPALRKTVDLRKLTQELKARTFDTVQLGARPSSAATGGSAQAQIDARVAQAKGTPIEAALMSDPWLQMAGISTNDNLTPDQVLERASPLRGLDVQTMMGIERQARAALAQTGQCLMSAPEPTGIVPLAKIMKDKFPFDPQATANDQAKRVDRMWNYLRSKLNYAVIAHEMGHTMGMRHNFASSWDKFNYRPQYWQLRTRGGTVTDICNGPVTDGSTCIGPRYYDPLDQDEIDQMIWMWSQTTVMDYAGDTTQDTLGLGVFDYSAARAFYADVVDVRADGVTVPSTGIAGRTEKQKIGAEMFDLVDTSIQPLAQTFVDDESDPQTPNYMHYSKWNNFFHILDKSRCRSVDTSPPQGWNTEKNGTYSAVFDGHIVRSEVCDRMPVDYVDWRDMVPDQTQVALTNYNPLFVLARRAVDNKGRPRMPYAFCSDEWVEGGISSCYQHDNGADIFEEMMFHDRLYEDRHIFDNFRRGRVTFSIPGAFSRTVGRYHNKIESLAGYYAFIHDFILHDFANSNGVPFSLIASIYEAEGGALRDFVLASSFAFDHFTRALSRPQPGPHFFKGQDTSILRPFDGAFPGSQGDVLDMHQGSAGMGEDVSYGGRPIENGFVSANGYYLVNSAGSYYDKTHAIRSLLAQGVPSANYTRAEGVDSRWLISNFTNLYPDGARRLIGAVLTEDQGLYAPRVATRASGFPMVTPVGIYQYPARPVGWVSFTAPDGPAICWPANGAESCTDDKGNPLPGMSASAPTTSLPVDPELGFEVQKFVLYYSYVYLPDSERNDWLDMLRIFRLGSDIDPSFDASTVVEWVDPQTGFHYVAKRFGDESLMGRTYDKGIASKMLQWANTLSALAYVPADSAAPFDPKTGRFGYMIGGNGQPVVAPDPGGIPPDDPSNVRCDENLACIKLRNFRGVIDFSRDIGRRFGVAAPCLNGIYQIGTWCD